MRSPLASLGALGNQGRGMHWALKTISHGLRAEAEGREERPRRALNCLGRTTPLRAASTTPTPTRAESAGSSPHAEAEGRARHTSWATTTPLRTSWATTMPRQRTSVSMLRQMIAIMMRWRRLLRGRKFFTGKGKRHPSVRRVNPAEIDNVHRFSPTCCDRAFMI